MGLALFYSFSLNWVLLVLGGKLIKFTFGWFKSFKTYFKTFYQLLYDF